MVDANLGRYVCNFACLYKLLKQGQATSWSCSAAAVIIGARVALHLSTVGHMWTRGIGARRQQPQIAWRHAVEHPKVEQARDADVHR